MAAWIWKLLGVSEDSPASRRKLGVIALLYFIQGAPATISAGAAKDSELTHAV